MLDQSIYVRMGQSNWLLGAGWRYSTSEVSFGGLLPPGLIETKSTVSGVSAIGLYEDVDFQMSPRKGLMFELKAEFNDDAFGSDHDFEYYSWELRQYFEFADKWTLAWRFDGATIKGDAPFYMEPFIDLQGIPAMRYQGPTVVTVEVRGGYDLTPRWTLMAFTGGGRVADDLSDLSSSIALAFSGK